MGGWTLHHGFVDDPEGVLAQVRDEVAWTRQMRSRQTASMGVPYNYSGATYPLAPWHPAVAAVRDRVGEALAFTPTNCLLNRYPTGDHTLGWHSDDTAILAPDTPIAIVSLGAERPLGLRRSRDDGFEYREVLLPPGSLFVMDQAMQAEWRHRVPRHPGAGLRISLTLRHITHVVTEAERRATQGRPPPW